MDKRRAIAEAITGIDDRYLAEAAQSGEQKRKRPIWKPVLSAAACVLLVLGLSLFRPVALKVTVNGKNVLRGTVSYTQSGDIGLMRLSLETEVPLTLEPGTKGSLTLTADENSTLLLDGREDRELTLTEKTECTWVLYPGADGYFLQLCQGEESWCIQAVPEETGAITICQVR